MKRKALSRLKRKDKEVKMYKSSKKNRKTAMIVFMAFFVSTQILGCVTSQNKPGLQIGMTKVGVKEAWGKPSGITRFRYGNKEFTAYEYRKGVCSKYLYFEEDILIGIQE